MGWSGKVLPFSQLQRVELLILRALAADFWENPAFTLAALRVILVTVSLLSD
jgi:hypothetical protein